MGRSCGGLAHQCTSHQIVRAEGDAAAFFGTAIAFTAAVSLIVSLATM
jgi:hypothetical protein